MANEEVRIVHEDGRFGSVPAANVAEAEKLGWRVERAADKAERNKGTHLENVVTSGAAGVAGTLLAPAQVAGAAYELATGNESPVAGLSGRQFVEDVGALMSDDVVQGANETRAMMEANLEARPIVSLGSEIAGQLVGSLPFGGLAGAAGKAAAAKAGLQGVAAARTAGIAAGALEGGALGATAVAEEAWLRDEVATAEHTLAGMGLGALFGGGVGAGMAALGAGAGKLSGLFGRGAQVADGGVAGAVDDLAGKTALLDETAAKVSKLEQVTEKASVKAENWFSNLSDDSAVAAIARQDQRAMREIGGPRGDIDRARRVGRVLKETGIVRGASGPKEMLARAEQVAATSGRQIGDTIAEIQKKGGFVEGKALMTRIDEQIGKFRDDGWTPEMAQIANKLNRTVGKVRERAEMGVLEQTDLHAFRMQLDKSIKWGSAQKSVATDALRELRGIVEEGIESEVQRIGKEIGSPDLLKEYARAKEVYRASRWAEETLSNRVGVRDQANRFFSLTDYGVGLAGAVSMGPAGALLGGAAALGNKLLRERGASLVSDVASRFARESVDLVAAPAGAQSTARSLRTILGNVDERMTKHVGGFFRRADTGERAAARATRRTATAMTEGSYGDRRKAYASHAEQVARMASNPEVAAAELAGLTGQNLPAVAPRLNAQMAATVARAASYLQAHTPAPARDPSSLTPHLDEPPPVSDGDLYEYAMRVEGVTEPLSLLEDLESGDVDPVKVEAVKAVWPQVFDGIRAKIFAELTLRTSPVPPEARKILDIALDANGAIEPSQAPRFLQTMRDAGQQVQQSAPRPPSGPAPSISKSLSTRSERIASL